MKLIKEKYLFFCFVILFIRNSCELKSHLKDQSQNLSLNKVGQKNLLELLQAKYQKQEKSKQEEKEEDKIDPFKVQKEGYLKIQSNNFIDQGRYPSMKIKTNSYRVMSVNKDSIEVEQSDSQEPYDDQTNFLENQKFHSIYFYFRLSNRNLYFTSDNKDMVVIAALSILNMQDIESSDSVGDQCLSISDIELDNWVVCASDGKQKEEWLCAIRNVLGQECHPVKITAEIVKQPVIVIPLHSKYCNEDWDYQENGDDWECKCRTGDQQSPIDLCRPSFMALDKGAQIEQNNGIQWEFSGRDSKQFELIYKEYKVGLVCKQNVDEQCENSKISEDDECSLGVGTDCDGSRFSLREVWFHTGSEHTIDKKRYDMEIQVIGMPLAGSPYTDKLVLSLLVEMTPEATNAFIDQLDIMNLPNLSTSIQPSTNKPVQLDLQQLFMGNHVQVFSPDFSYYYYRGSMTNPQCNQEVRWVIAAQSIPLALPVLQMFKDALKEDTSDSNRLWNNYRHTQKNANKVSFYKAAVVSTFKGFFDIYGGHFEKIKQKEKQFVYVPDKEKSKLSNSQVVTDTLMNQKLYHLYNKFGMFSSKTEAS